MTRDSLPGAETTRRAMLAGAGLAGLAGAVTGCGMLRNDVMAAARQEDAKGESMAGSPSPASMPPMAAQTLAAASEIPVGGGKVFSAAKVVVTQPEAGQFKAFSAVCTHQQCLVDKVAMGRIDCPCHGSQFSVKDGSPVAGPAMSPLPPVRITVAGGKITLA